jgi:fructose-1-phosphate kinase PfkB-like protein
MELPADPGVADSGVVVSAIGQGSALASDSSAFRASIPSTEASDIMEALDTMVGTTIPTGILRQMRTHILDTTLITVIQPTKHRQ